jgi:hypothetical protein
MKSLFSLLAAVIALSACEVSSDKTNATPSASQDSTKTLNWAYSAQADEMTGEVTYSADCYSLNEVEPMIPGSGNQKLALRIQKQPNGSNEVILGIEGLAFMLGAFDQTNLRVKFDDEKPIYFAYNEASDPTLSFIFIRDPKRFIDKAKKAKKLMIEPQFINQGKHIFHFDVSGLKWNH